MSCRMVTTLLLCSVYAAAIAADDPAPRTDPPPAPSLELLEFLADFDRIDPETLELLDYHARRDLQQAAPEPPPGQELNHDDD